MASLGGQKNLDKLGGNANISRLAKTGHSGGRKLRHLSDRLKYLRKAKSGHFVPGEYALINQDARRKRQCFRSTGACRFTQPWHWVFSYVTQQARQKQCRGIPVNFGHEWDMQLEMSFVPRISAKVMKLSPSYSKIVHAAAIETLVCTTREGYMPARVK